VVILAKAMRRSAAALLLLGAAGLSGCGFKPLYAQPGVVQNLAAMDVVAPDGRAGFLIREHLEDSLARNRGAAPVYRMDLQLSEARYPRGVRVDNVATRYEYVLTAVYVVRNAASGTEAKRGAVHVELTYDSADQPYAAIAAQQDAQDRAAEEAARRIELELASWLAAGARPEGRPPA
jgi:LPS-assembly lipoprotein